MHAMLWEAGSLLPQGVLCIEFKDRKHFYPRVLSFTSCFHPVGLNESSKQEHQPSLKAILSEVPSNKNFV